MDNFGIFIGRFQPFHNGHEALVRKIIADGRQPLILIPTFCKFPNDPFTYEQRKRMIELVFENEAIQPRILPIRATIRKVSPTDGLPEGFDASQWRDEVESLIDSSGAQDIKFYYGDGETRHLYVDGKYYGEGRLSSTVQRQFSAFLNTDISPVRATHIREQFIDNTGNLKAAATAWMNPKVIDYINAECKSVLSQLARGTGANQHVTL